MCRNVAKDEQNQLLRHENVAASAVSTVEPGESDVVHETSKPESLFNETLQRLSEEDHSLADLMLEGYTVGEIGTTLGIKEPAQQLENLRARLHKLLAKG
jgi:DNA-binding NarL/FixJ family response regulator